MVLKFFENLSNSYLELLNDEEDFNIIINVGESPNTKIFRAHSVVLKYRSLYFRNELANINSDENNVKTINLKHVSTQQFEIIIKYIYGGIISLENLDNLFIFNLMLIACELLFEELAERLEAFLIKTKASWLRLQFSQVFQKSFQIDQLQELQKWCTNNIVKYPNMIFESENFTSIQENTLISLIKRDDLQMEEVKIWKRVIEWGITRNPGLSSDPKTWTSENFLAMKTTLQNCLPHIRYFQIPGDDIIDNLQPYQQILDKNLWDDIIKRLVSPNRPILSVIFPPRKVLIQTLPPRETEPFSKIISEAHAAEIASWIDLKDNIYSVANNPYEFKLLLRGTRDGFTHASFWNLCESQTNVVVVVKVKDTDEILGGYNPVGWDKPKFFSPSRFMDCKESFIFSLKNGVIQNTILSRVKTSSKAIYCNFSGVSSSFGEYGDDLSMYNKTWECRKRSYERPIRSVNEKFSAEEYEIFQISKKP